MKERPILFCGEMVRAILEERKTQTRRVLKTQPEFPFGVSKIVLVPDPWHNEAFAGTTAAGMGNTGPRKLQWHCEAFAGNLVARWDGNCPYGQPGDRLWVREAFGYAPASLPEEHAVSYRVDHKCNGWQPMRFDWPQLTVWRPSIHMPRWASRITLEIESVRVERVQDITEADAKAEGVECPRAGAKCSGYIPTCGPDEPADCVCIDGYVPLYQELWDSINSKTHPWSANPWVWVLTFHRVKP